MSQKDEVERVVSMKFDNGQFEKGVSTSLKTIDQLKKSLDFSETEKGLSEFQNASKNFDVSGIEKGLDKLNNRFSVFGEKWHDLKTNVLDGIIGIGKKMFDFAKSTAVTGWEKYEQETAAVQTMMGNMTDADFAMYLLTQKKIEDFEDKELELLDPKAYKKAREAYLSAQIEMLDTEDAEQSKLEYIEQNLERITWFADETSYSYNDMTSSLANFLSTGRQIGESTSAVIGLAVAAADAGVSTKTATTAFQQLTQAVQAGRLRLEDWRPIMRIGMNTPKFTQNLIDTAVALGTLQENADGTYTVLTAHEKKLADSFTALEGFTESLAGNWATPDVLLKTFELYGSYADMLYDIQNAYDLGTVDDARDKIEELGLEYVKVAQTGFDAAQNTKSFTEAVEFLQDALSTQFKSVYKTIFGGFLEAKKLWTNLSDVFYNNLVYPMEQFTAMIDDWAGREEGGRDSLMAAFANGIEYVVQLLSVFREAAAEAFPNFTADRLAELTLRFEKWTENLKLSDERFQEVKEGLSGILKFIRGILIDLKDLFNLVKPALKKVISLIVTIISKVGKLLGKIADADERIGHLGGAVEYCSEKLKEWREKIKDATGIDLHIPKWEEITDVISRFTAKVNDLTGLNLHLPTWKEIVDALTRFKDKIIEITGIDFHLPTWEEFKNTVLDVVHYLEQFLGIDIKMPTLDSLAESVANVINYLKDFKNNLTSTKEDVEKLSISDHILAGWNKLGDVIDTVKFKIMDLFSKKNRNDAQDTLDVMSSSKDHAGWNNFKERLTQIYETIKGPISKITANDLVSFGMIGTIIRLIWQWGSLSKGLTTIAGGIGNLFKSVGEGTKSFLKTIGGGWSSIGAGIKGFFDKLGTSSKDKTWKTRAAAFKDIAIAVGIIAASIIAMTFFADKESIGKAIGIVAALTAFIIVVSILLDKLDAPSKGSFTLYKSGNRGFLGIAAGIVAILLSLRILRDYKSYELWGYYGIIVAFGALLTLMVTVSKIGGKTGIGTGVAFFLAAVALQKMAKVLEQFDGLNLEHKRQTLQLLAGTTAALMAVMVSLKGVKLGSGLGLLGMVTAIKQLVNVIKSLSAIDSENIRKNQGIIWAIGVFVALITILNGVLNQKTTASIQNSKNNIVKISNNMIGIGAAFLLIMLSFKMASSMNLEQPVATALMMLEVFAGLGALMWVASSAGQYTKNAGKVALKIAAAMGILVLAMELIQFMDWPAVWKGLAVIGGLTIAFAVLIRSASHYEEGTKKLTGLFSMVTLLILLAAIIGTFHPSGMEVAVADMLMLMVGMAIVISTASRIKNKAADEAIRIIFVLGVVVAGITFVLSKCDDMLKYDWKSILAYMGGMTLLITAIGLVSKVTGKYKSTIKDSSAELLEIGIFIGGFIAITKALSAWSSSIDIEKSVATVAMGAGLITVIALLAKKTGKYKSTIKDSSAELLEIGIFIGGFIAITKALSAWSSSIDPLGAAVAMAGGAVLLRAIGKAVNEVPKNTGTIKSAGSTLVIMAGFIGGFIGIAWALSKWSSSIDPLAAAATMVSGSIMILAIARAAELLVKYNTTWGESLRAVLIVAVLSGAIMGIIWAIGKFSSSIDPITAAVLFAGATVLLLAIAAVALIAAGVGALAKPAIIGGIIIIAFMVVLAALVALAGSVLDATVLEKGVVAFILLGEAIGGFFGGIIAGFKEGKAAELPNIANYLGQFGDNIGGFANISTIPDSVKDKSSVIYSAAQNMKKISDLTFNETSDIGTILQTYAGYVVNFANSLKDIDQTGYERMGTVAELITAITNALTGIYWTNDVSAIGEDMAAYGKSLNEFIGYLSDITEDHKTKAQLAADILSIMAGAAGDVPNGTTDGRFNLLSFFAGDNDIDDFGEKMKSYAVSLVAFGSILTMLSPDIEKKTSLAAGALAAMANAAYSVPNSRFNDEFNLASWFAGDNDIDLFGAKMQKYAVHLVAFDSILTMLSPDIEKKTERAAGALAAMADAAHSIPNGRYQGKFNLLSFLMGDNEIDSFGEKMRNYAMYLKGFDYWMKDVGSDIVTRAGYAAGALTAMADAAHSIPGGYNSDGKFSLYTFLTGNENSVEAFGNNMVLFAGDLVSFVAIMNGINEEELKRATDWLTNILTVLSGITYADSDTVWEFGYNLAQLADIGIDAFVDAFTESEEDVQSAYDSFFGYFKNAIDDPNKRQEISQIFEGFLTAIIVRVNMRHDDFVKSGEDTIQGFLDGMQTKIDSVSEADGLNPGDILAKIVIHAIDVEDPEFFQTGLDAIQNVINGMMEGVSGVPYEGSDNPGSKLAESVLEGYRNKAFSFSEAGATGIQAILNGMNGEIESIPIETNVNPGGRLAHVILEGCTSNTQDFSRAGSNLVKGFVEGVKDEIDSIPTNGDNNPGEKLVKTVHNGAVNFAMIHSPSRLFYRDGLNCVRGFINSFSDSESELTEVGIGIVENVQNGIEKVYPTIQNAASKVDSLLGTNLSEKAENLKGTVESYADAVSGLGDTVQNNLGGIIGNAIESLTGENAGLESLVEGTISNMMTEIQNEIGAGFTTELDITPVLDMDELKNSLGIDLGYTSGLFDLSGTTSIAEDAIASGLGTNDLLADEISGLRGDVQGFYQAYMDDDGIDTDEIARATEAGVASGLSKATVAIDGTTAGKVISNKQSTYERANGGSKVVATWYR